MTITITGLPLQGTVLDSTLIPVETAGVTAHITASSIKSYLSAGTLTSISVGSGTVSGALSVGTLYSGAISASTVTTTGDVNVGGNLTFAQAGASLTFGNIATTNANITSNINLSGSIIPTSNLASALGSSAYWFGNTFSNSAYHTTLTTNAMTANTVTTGIVVGSANTTANLGTATNWFNNMYSVNATHNALTITGSFVPSANATVNIGSSSNWFNTIWGTSSHALYADLAEKYQSDEVYEPGTVLIFGDNTEVTISSQANDTRVAGVVSTDPAYLMNDGLDGVSVAVALQGRVPCKVTGTVVRGDLMVSSDIPGVAMSSKTPQIGTVIGKALGSHIGNDIGVIEVVVGRI
jgi:hypothetical protein